MTSRRPRFRAAGGAGRSQQGREILARPHRRRRAAGLQRSQAFLDALQSQINGLYTEFVATDDPVQRAIIEKKRLDAIAEQDRVKAEIARLTKAIAAIEDEARRANVPAGWLR